jgi:signal transduction histidine kinase
MRFLVPVGQRPYVASHPLGVWLSAGIAFTGWINVLFPALTAEAASRLAFEPLVLFLFNLAWAFGGSVSLGGLLRGRAKVEGAGMAVLASALASYYFAILAVRPSAAVSGGFIAFLAVGCAFRAWHLATHGYVNLDVPLDQPGLK